jgi:hypothetical protein
MYECGEILRSVSSMIPVFYLLYCDLWYSLYNLASLVRSLDSRQWNVKKMWDNLLSMQRHVS